jgi:hypothetical protein
VLGQGITLPDRPALFATESSKRTRAFQDSAVGLRRHLWLPSASADAGSVTSRGLSIFVPLNSNICLVCVTDRVMTQRIKRNLRLAERARVHVVDRYRRSGGGLMING